MSNPIEKIEGDTTNTAKDEEESKIISLVHRSSSRFIAQEDELPIKIIGPNNEEIFPEDIVVAPDGGWGWVIVFAAFMSNVIVDGTIFSFGILLTEILETKTPKTPTVTELAWVGGIVTGFYLGSGPVVSAIANIFGFRATAIAGSFVSFFGFMMAYYFCQDGMTKGPNMLSLFLFYGVIGGIGFCLLYVPSIITVGFYFEKKRAIATGIAVCGSGIGTFIFAPLVRFLISKVHWPTTIMIQAFLLLSLTFIAALYRPLHPIQKKSINKSNNNNNQNPSMINSQTQENTSVIVRVIRGDRTDIEILASKNSRVSTYGEQQKQQQQQNQSNIIPPRTNPQVPNTMISTTELYQAKQKISVTSENLIQNSLPQVTIPKRTMVSVPNMSINQTIIKPGNKFSGDVAPSKLTSGTTQPIQAQIQRGTVDYSGVVESTRSLQSTKSTAPTITLVVKNSSEADGADSRVFRVASKKTLNKPLYRQHIFYTGDLENIQENVNKDGNVEWEAAPVTLTDELKNLPEKKRWKCKCEFNVFKKMLDFSLLKSLTFVLLASSGGISFLGFFVPFLYLNEVAVSHKIAKENAAALIAVIGAANTVGRVICGCAANKLIKRVLLINNVALTVGGLATVCVPFIDSYPIFILYSTVFGLSIACFISLRTILIVELVGLNNLTNAVGLSLLFQGLASFFGGPLAGFLKETTGEYDVSFYVAGSLMLISGIMCYPLHIMNAWEKKRQEQKELQIQQPVLV